MLRNLYWLNAALLAIHEADSGYVKEWDLLHLPAGMSGFLLVNVPLFFVVFLGFAEIVGGRRRGLWFSLLLVGAGLCTFVAHGAFLLLSGAPFKMTASIGLLLAIGVVSIAQLAVTLRAFFPKDDWQA